MAISFQSQAQAGTTSVTLGAHQPGDLIIIFAYRNALTAPSLGAGYTNLTTASANANSCRVGYRVARSSSETSGTWTNANVLQCVIYRGAGLPGTAASTTKAASTTANIPTIAMANGAGTSWVVAFAGSKQTTSQGTPLAGATTLRGTAQAGTTSMAIVADTNAGVASFSATTSANGSSVTSAGATVEILPGNALTETINDAFPGSSLNAQWGSTPAGGSIVVGSGVLTLTPASNSAGDGQQIKSSATLSMLGSFALVQMTSVLTGDEFSSLFADVADGSGDRMVLTQYNGNLEARYTVGGAETVQGTAAYNATTMKWLRIRESAGTLFWDYSADGLSWTNLTSLAGTLGVIAMQIGLETYENTGVISPGTAVYDYFNMPTPIGRGVFLQQAVNRAGTY